MPANSVSAGNPCPFLRALVANGFANDQYEPIGRLSRTISRIAAASEGGKPVPSALVALIALAANGLSPSQLYRNSRDGVHVGGLRGGPLDKRGVGSRIIRTDGLVDDAELARFESFASPKTRSDGYVEPGLDLAEVTRFMDANWERARGQRRRIDRTLMDGEWPVLLEVLGQQGIAGRYLAVADVRRLVLDFALPERLTASLTGAGRGRA